MAADCSRLPRQSLIRLFQANESAQGLPEIKAFIVREVVAVADKLGDVAQAQVEEEWKELSQDNRAHEAEPDRRPGGDCCHHAIGDGGSGHCDQILYPCRGSGSPILQCNSCSALA